MITAIIAYFLIKKNNQNDMTSDVAVTEEKKDCGCGGQTTASCACKKHKIGKIVAIVAVAAVIGGVAYWAYVNGYFTAAIEKIKGLTTKTA